MSNTILQGSIEGKRRRPRTQWQDNIVECTILGIEEAMRATRDRDRWKRIILKSTAPLQNPKYKYIIAIKRSFQYLLYIIFDR